jgi:hypothetical protein
MHHCAWLLYPFLKMNKLSQRCSVLLQLQGFQTLGQGIVVLVPVPSRLLDPGERKQGKAI